MLGLFLNLLCLLLPLIVVVFALEVCICDVNFSVRLLYLEQHCLLHIIFRFATAVMCMHALDDASSFSFAILVFLSISCLALAKTLVA